MAYATQVTISTGNKVTFNYQSREVGVSLTYCLESSDTDLMQVVRDKATEVAQAHGAAWQKMRDEKVAKQRSARNNGKAATGASRQATVASLTLVEQPVQNGTTSEDEVEIEEPEVFQPASEAQRKAITALFNASLLTDSEFEVLLQERFGWSTVEELSHRQASGLLVELQRSERERLARQRNDRRWPTATKET